MKPNNNYSRAIILEPTVTEGELKDIIESLQVVQTHVNPDRITWNIPNYEDFYFHVILLGENNNAIGFPQSYRTSNEGGYKLNKKLQKGETYYFRFWGLEVYIPIQI